MKIQEMSIREIELGDETFRISEVLDLTAILNSLREIGQLNPVVLMEQIGRIVLVCGFRRVQAMSKLGANTVVAQILPESFDRTRAFLLALWDNLSHRQLNPLEKARILFKLKNSFSIPDEKLTREYLPLLGLNPNESVLRAYILLNSVRPVLRQCLIDGRLTHTSVAFLAEMPVPVQDSLGALMGKIRLSASLQRKFLDLLEDLSAARGLLLHEPLESPEVLEVADDSRLSLFQRGEKIYEHLYRKQNPRLTEALERFAVHKKLLGLPGSIQITAHAFFEEPGLRVEFAAADLERFRKLAAALHQASEKPEAEDLFAVK